MLQDTKEKTGYPSIDKPWRKYYGKRALETPLPDCSVYEFMRGTNKDHPDATAILYFNRKISFAQFFENIDKTACAFGALGVKKGDIVCVAMPNIPEAIYTIFALNKIGAVANLLHPLAGEQELLHYFDEVNSEVAVMFDGTYEIVKNILPRSSIKHAVIATAGDSLPMPLKAAFAIKTGKLKLSDNCITWKDFINGGKTFHGDFEPHKLDDLTFILHTGGTTGSPKGVMLSDKCMNAVSVQMAGLIGDVFGDTREDRMLVVLPPFIGYSLINSIFEPLNAGMTIVLVPKYEADKQGEYFSKYKINHINSIPAYWNSVLTDRKFDGLDMSKVKILGSGGDGMSTKVENELNEFFHAHGCSETLIKGLGCTEMGSAATIGFHECSVVGSVGIPMPANNCGVFDPDTGKELPYNEEGELCFTGPSVMIGYYNNREATDDMVRVHEDGQRWVHMGDLGYVTEDGIVYITGRIKRIIMIQGSDGIVTKIFPDRIEKAILEHPQAELCCVVGTKHATRIHVPNAAVVLKEGEHDENAIRVEIMKICREKLPDYMLPEEIRFMKDFPRTEARKVDYRKIEEMFS